MLTGTGLLAALLVGLLGGVHCVGMCGGIAALLGGSLPQHRRWPLLLAYNLGRIASYAAVGALFGGLGNAVAATSGLPRAQLALTAAAGGFLVLLGLHLGGWGQPLLFLERLGGNLVWRRLEPLGRRYLPPTGAREALVLGAIWGWLPCGLVYSVAVWALSAGSAGQGALLLLAFGLGTLPNLLAMGWAAQKLRGWLARPAARRLAGLLIVGMGGTLCWRALTALQ